MANFLTYQDKRIAVGDRILVKQVVKEDDKSRIQIFEGLLISVRGQGDNQSFVVRKIAAGNIGVERIFPVQSPHIESIEVKSRGNVRRANLSYLKARVGRSALRVKENKSNQATKKAA
jgi:large subunit ribosomal protein L19